LKNGFLFWKNIILKIVKKQSKNHLKYLMIFLGIQIFSILYEKKEIFWISDCNNKFINLNNTLNNLNNTWNNLNNTLNNLNNTWNNLNNTIYQKFENLNNTMNNFNNKIDKIYNNY